MVMSSIQQLRTLLSLAPAEARFVELYGSQPGTLSAQRQRYAGLLDCFQSQFPELAAVHGVRLFSTPGRTEVGGNHTDHNAGRVLAAAVNRDVLAAASPTRDGLVTIYSEGYPPLQVDTRSLGMVDGERGTTPSLVRGVCARLQQLGYPLGGFAACMTSSIPTGAGLSSSAAFEVQVITILEHLLQMEPIDPLTKAQIARFAENEYFGKPCGLMDQTTCAVGGFVTIDFQDFQHPVVHKVDYDFSSSGYALVIVETGGSHADLTEDYASVQQEMRNVARALGGQVLRPFSREQVVENMGALKSAVNERAVLRALHFFADNQRVIDQVQALEAGCFPRFLELVNASGASSWMLLQNGYSPRCPTSQGITLAQAATREWAERRPGSALPAAWRVHGGGFAGTIQAFIPQQELEDYIEFMEGIFGAGACYPVLIRTLGSTPVF
jgi:galactokinase